MRQSEKSTLLLSSETAKKQLQKRISEATAEFYKTFDYTDIEPSLSAVMLGWISSEFIEQSFSLERINLFGFFLEINKHFQLTSKHQFEKEKELFPLHYYDQILCTDLNKSKDYLKEVTTRFLESEFADERQLRQNVVYHLDFIDNYINKIHTIYFEEKSKN